MKLPEGESRIESVGLTTDQFKTIVTAGLSTQILHTVSRVASLVAQGYYTIGLDQYFYKLKQKFEFFFF